MGRRWLGGTRGFGVDIDARKVNLARTSGLDCFHADATNLPIPDNAVRFTILNHFLEHLPSLRVIELALRCAARVSSDYLYINGPYFDADTKLAEMGLKLFWSDWHGHPSHLRTTELLDMVRTLNPEKVVGWYVTPISHSDHPAIHPLASLQDQQQYDPSSHPPKPSRPLGTTVYEEMGCLVFLRLFPDWAEVCHSVLRRFGQADPMPDTEGFPRS
jgi:hypothetical protein